MNYQDLFDNTDTRNFVKQSDETIAKRVSKTTGQKRSQEIRDKMQKAGFSGRSHTTETRATLSAYNKGKVISEETRAKISARLKGKPSHSKKTIQTPYGLFASRGEAAKAIGCDTTTIGWRLKKLPEQYYYVNKGE